MWSALEEVGKYIWGRKGYPWVGMDVVGTRCDSSSSYYTYGLRF